MHKIVFQGEVMENNNNFEVDFLSFVSLTSTQSYIAMGKMANPITGKIEKNIPVAKYNIDVLRMLRDKTQGNLTKEEEKFLKDTITNLELNFVDVLKGEQKEKSKQETNNKKDGINTQTR